MNSFLHAGDLGDIVYSLPTIKALEGGNLYLNRWPNRTRVQMNQEQIDFISPLLLEQHFISSVDQYRGQSVCYDLNYFREYWSKNAEFGVSIAEWHCRAFKVDSSVINEPWLIVEKRTVCPVVFHRSARYHNPEFPWKRIVDRYRDRACFLGLKSEHVEFESKFGHVRFFQASNALEMAEVIAGASLFVGNQSLPAAIAEGLKVPKILEVFMIDPNCCFERMDSQHIFTRNVYLPNV